MHAAKETIWLHRLKGTLSNLTMEATTLFCDNQAALRLAQDDNYHAQTKHIDIHFHFICDIVECGEILLAYCPTSDMTADLLTKALLHWKVVQHGLALGLGRPCGGVMNMGNSGAPMVQHIVLQLHL